MHPSTKATAAAGTWPSPVTPEKLASASIRLAQPCVDGENTYWLEGRPTELGRSVLVVSDAQGQQTDLTPAPYDVLSRVHEYGGSAYLVSHGQVFFINASDQGIYRIHNDNITCVYQQEHTRFTNMALDINRDRLVLVVEQHGGNEEPQNFLGSVCLTKGELKTICHGADFYSSPAFNPDYSQLAFLSWKHPNMPWDETTLQVAEVGPEHDLSNVSVVSTGFAAFSPQFGPDDRLYFVSDQSNWWNLYVRDTSGNVSQLTDIQGELAMPHWIFGMSTYGFINPDTIIGAYSSGGLWQVCSIDTHSGKHYDISPWSLTAIEHLAVNGDGIVCHAASPDQIDAIIRVHLEPQVTTQLLQSASEISLDPAMVSRASPITFGNAGSDKPGQNQPGTLAYGFHYAPQNATTTLAEGEKPPLIVLVHGGPTTATGSGLNPRIQFWTSRGFAVLDVNYRGSTGFGRAFRHSLRGQWGKFDVEDCVNGAQYLIDRGLAHPGRVYIMGGSAGGYTVLSALTFTDFFAGGISLYGIGDLALLIKDTHKFEARYTDTLVGPYDKKLYRDRSPLFFADQIRVPVLFFQGTEDKMVPPNQAETMVNALKKNGVPVGYVQMIGEGHGFRRADSIITLMNTSLAFLLKVMGQNDPTNTPLKLYNDDQLSV